jgi:hypothetical protein
MYAYTYKQLILVINIENNKLKENVTIRIRCRTNQKRRLNPVDDDDIIIEKFIGGKLGKNSKSR